jgi:hypothetical protein
VSAEAARRFLVARHFLAPPRSVEAMGDALRAYLRFTGADRLEWAPHLTAEERVVSARP